MLAPQTQFSTAFHRMFNKSPSNLLEVLKISPLLPSHNMPLNTNLASSHDQESSLPSADHELDFLDNSLIPNNSFVHNHSFPHDPSFAPAPDNSFPQNDFFSHNNSFPQDNSIDIPTSLTISHPTTSQQYTPPHMLQSDTHMDPTISTPSSSNNLSISHLLPSTGYDTEW